MPVSIRNHMKRDTYYLKNYHVLQVPHAMARHNPGDYPSANVRTAPTPSEPNTPIAEPGFTVPNTFSQQQQQPHQHPPPLPEEEVEEPPMPEAK